MKWMRELDGLLRGERTRSEDLQGGQFDLPLTRFMAIALALGGVYGFFMGWFALTGDKPRQMQVLASVLKVPALFALTLLITFPSLYVLNALVGCRLRFLATLRLLVASIVVSLALAASLGPILAFFTLSTSSYAFIVLLNVGLLAMSGLGGLGFLLTVLRRLSSPPAPGAAAGSSDSAPGIFYLWILIYGMVGMQLGWLMRPFIGHPDRGFEWFRPRDGNFLHGIATAIRALAGG